MRQMLQTFAFFKVVMNDYERNTLLDSYLCFLAMTQLMQQIARLKMLLTINCVKKVAAQIKKS